MALMSRGHNVAPPSLHVQRRQRRQLKIAALCAFVGVAVFAGPAVYKAMVAAPVDPNRAVAANVLRLGAALDTYATRMNRPRGELTLPRTDAFLTFVGTLPEGQNQLLNPWAAQPQATLLAAGGATRLPTAAQHAAGTPLPIVGTVLGLGVAPGAAPLSVRTYGAVVYDHDPKSDSYVLYGVGQAGDKAVVAAAVARKL